MNVDHDPLCPQAMGCVDPRVRHPAAGVHYACCICGLWCLCYAIAVVRADERERAITILSNFTARFIEDARGGVA